MDSPYGYQRWLITYVRESRRTRKVIWITDIAGNSGKSLMTDVLEMDPNLGVCRISLDYSRAFKYLAALDIKTYVEQRGSEPNLLIIDAPRDEESKFLHEIYGTLEEINNGRVEGFFSGSRIKMRIQRNIPIIVISNAPPVLKAFSRDRWDIKAIYETVDGNDRFIQNAKAYSNINSVTGNIITWTNVVETVPYIPNEVIEFESDQLLLDMYTRNIKDMKFAPSPNPDKKYPLALGLVKIKASEQTVELRAAPEYVKRQYQIFVELRDSS